jgi:SAM-dependent methyltransferase
MKRDIVCRLRLVIDSLPSWLRNSRFLFEIARHIFKLPPSLYFFRKNYDDGLILDLSEMYNPLSPCSLERVTQSTDINSFHLELIEDYFIRFCPASCLDAGCGSGFLINKLHSISANTRFVGIDYQQPFALRSKTIEYKSGDLLSEIEKIHDREFDIVICAHVIEHTPKPKAIVKHLKRISRKCLIIICPLEKKFCWGLNYHINFFPDFAVFLSSALSGDASKSLDGIIYEKLGDIMYVETYFLNMLNA